MVSGPIASWKIEGEKVGSSWALKSLQMVTIVMKLEDVCFLAGKLWQTWTVCLKTKTSLWQQKSIQLRLWFFQ